MAILFAPYFRATDQSNAPIPGAFASFYATGTSTPQPIWANSTLTVSLSNPIQSDGNGVFPSIWLDDTLPPYKIILQYPDVNNPNIPGAIVAGARGTVDPYNTALTAGSQTAAESAAGITPVNIGFGTLPYADVRRYGVIADGVTDDTAALQTALNVSNVHGLGLVIPYGYVVKITDYVEVHSNTTLLILGTIQLTNRSSGLFANGASNINILGQKTGTFTDPSVALAYDWNHASGVNHLVSPAIHIRSSNNVLIDGLNLTNVVVGIQFSNATANTAVGATWVLTQPISPSNCRVSNCNTQFCELGGITGYSLINSGYDSNYVYRCGDGGMWMMGGTNVYCINNDRVSPYATPADVTSFGSNKLAHPTTWNDEQGLEFENCQGLIVNNNRVTGFWAQGIDIKNSCNNVTVDGNRVLDCENGSIVTREGDAFKSACHKVSITNNTISGHGTLQYSIPNGVLGAIRTGETFICEIYGNIINGYQTTPGINCQGPGAYLASVYGANPHQAHLSVCGNAFNFKNSSFQTVADIGFTSSTLGAIIINGQYDSVLCNDNKISTDKYLATESRLNASPAIQMNQVNANSTFYPISATFVGNQIANWGQHGISVAGFNAATYSGVVISGNAISTCGGSGIVANNLRACTITGNVITQPGSGSGSPGIDLVGSSGNNIDNVTCTGNTITGRFDGGTNSMTYCIRTTFGQNINLSNNVMLGAATATILFTSPQGDHILTGSTGFPRTGSATPNASVTSYYRGEDFFDSTAFHWYRARTFNSTAWDALN